MEAERRTVLLVIEEPAVRELLAESLRAAGCYPLAVASSSEAARLAGQVQPDALVLELEDDAPSALACWQASVLAHPVPTVVLGEQRAAAPAGAPPAQGAGLWLSKPVQPRALVREVLRLLRPSRLGPGVSARTARRPDAAGSASGAVPSLRLGGLQVDRDAPTLRLRRAGRWREASLPRTEHRLLLALLSSPDRVQRREALRAAVWDDATISLRTVDQVVRRLRVALDALGCPGLVRTVPTVGYRVEPAAVDEAPTPS